MNNTELKIRGYSTQLNSLIQRIESHPEQDDLLELAAEFRDEASEDEIDSRAILDINQEIMNAVKDGKPEDHEAKYIPRLERLCKRIIRAFNYSGTEKILTGEALKNQWKKRNAMSRGENEAMRFDARGKPFNGVIEGRRYEGGMKFNGISDGFLYQRGKRYNGWGDDGFYYREGLRHTGVRLTWREIIHYKNGKEVGREPRTDVEEVE